MGTSENQLHGVQCSVTVNFSAQSREVNSLGEHILHKTESHFYFSSSFPRKLFKTSYAPLINRNTLNKLALLGPKDHHYTCITHTDTHTRNIHTYK